MRWHVCEETSGTKEGLAVRGYFGRGLKEAILGLGSGSVLSLFKDKFTRASIEVEDRVPRYKREKPVRASRALREQFAIESGNATIVEITCRQGIRVPQLQSLRTRLERHFALRDILSNSHRRVLLVEVDQKDREKREYDLRYKFPPGEEVLRQSVKVPGYEGAQVEVEVFRAQVPLEGPASDREAADGGLIIKSPRAALDLTLFKFEHDPAAERFFGKVNCPFLDTLLIQGEPIVKADRTGIDWSHDFSKALRRAVENLLEPIVDTERERAKESQHAAVSRALQERLTNALSVLNRLAQLELGRIAPGDETDEKLPFIPEGGFGFVPPYAQIVVGKQAMLMLRAAKTGQWKPGSIVQITSDNDMVLVHTEHVVLDQDPEHDSIFSAKIILEGRQVGAESIITAALDMARAEALALVISKRKPPEPPSAKKKQGLFHDFRFDENADPRHRVRFDDGVIVVAISALSVRPYIGPGGKGTETSQGQVMLAELVTEAVCKEIARQGILKGGFIFAPGAEADALQREYIRLQNQYAHGIHELLVNPEFRGTEAPKRLGRPPRHETLSRSTLPV